MRFGTGWMDSSFVLRKRVRCAADDSVYAMQICPHFFSASNASGGLNPQRLSLICSDLAVRMYDA
eukprot:SAG31_NODE_31245_length_370_cov_0.948339_1_plen_64_part_01